MRSKSVRRLAVAGFVVVGFVVLAWRSDVCLMTPEVYGTRFKIPSGRQVESPEARSRRTVILIGRDANGITQEFECRLGQRGEPFCISYLEIFDHRCTSVRTLRLGDFVISIVTRKEAENEPDELPGP